MSSAAAAPFCTPTSNVPSYHRAVVFSAVTDKKQGLHSNPCGTGNERGSVQPDFKVCISHL